MELVKGQPITEYCDQNQLTLRERLELFLPVCHAIQHAHQKGIIHRDIKPSNVLVAEYDGRPVAKVIDFGVAKAVNQPLTERTMFTGLGQIIGTLEYMSPEQARVNQLDIDTRSDVYSLGVLLYELLTGSTPFDRKRLREAALDELLRIIRDEEPPRPSTKLSSSQTLPEIAADRRTEPARLSTLIRSELDWIVMKALEKDRNRRYESASGFAMDIQRYLAGELVQACPPSAVYRFRKFARKNKALLASTTLVSAALVCGLIGTTWQAIRATRAEDLAIKNQQEALAERDQKELARREAQFNADQAAQATRREMEQRKIAEAAAESQRLAKEAEAQQRVAAEAAEKRAKDEAAIATAISDFLQQDLLGLAGAAEQIAADIQPEPELQLGTLLDRALGKVEERFGDQPQIRAALQATLANAFKSIGRYTEATELWEKVSQFRQETLGIDHPEMLEIMNNLAQAYGNAGQWDRALPLFEQTLELKKARLGIAHPDTLVGMCNLAGVYQDAGQYDKGLALHEQTLDLAMSSLGPDHDVTLTCISNLGVAYWETGQTHKALPLFEQTLELTRARLGDEHPDTLNNMNNLAMAYHVSKQFDKALPLYEQTLELGKTILGNDHPQTLMYMGNVAGAYQESGDLDKALPLSEQTLKMSSAKLGPKHPWTLNCMTNLAVVYQLVGQPDKALPLQEQSLELMNEILGSKHPKTLNSMNNLAGFYRVAGQLDKALHLYEQTLDLTKASLGTEHPQTLNSMYGLANNPIQVGDYLYFARESELYGIELWKSDGTLGGTVMLKDIYPGRAWPIDGGSQIFTNLTDVNGTLYFRTSDGAHGFELWKTDGTYGYELWRSDGTPSGTSMVKDIRPGIGRSNPDKLTNVNGTLFFSANDGATGYELWKSDGTPNGTVLVKDIHAGWNSSYVANLTNVNGLLFFIANDGSSGTELWRSNGTTAGTSLVKDVRPGSGSSTYSNLSLVNVGGTLYFVANDGTHGFEVWKSNTTGTGAEMVANVIPDNNSAYPNSLIGFQGEIYFQVDSPVLKDIWKTDGTSAGTQIAIPQTTGGSFLWHYENFEAIGGKYFFGADDGIHGREIWKSDGTTSGTALVKDINPGSPGGTFEFWTPMGGLNGELLLLANDGTHGYELWKSNGTEAGTVLLKDIRPGSASSYPAGFVSGHGKLYFPADNGLNGAELWTTDGTTGGTSLFKDIRPGPAGSGAGPMAMVGDTLFLFANDGTSGRELWKSDATASGTVLVKDIRPGGNSSNPAYGTEMNGILYFVANNGIHGEELWRSDGTAEGTTLVKDIRPGSSPSNSRNLVNINGTLFFEADDGIHGSELWKSDGTAAGTVMVKNINPSTGSTGAASRVMHLVNINGTLYFSANDGIHGEELWTSDGTAEGTKMVANLTDGSGGSLPRVIGELGDGKLMVLASTAAHGRELYVLQLPGDQASVQASYIYHAGSSFAGSGIETALDTSKQLAKEGAEPLRLTYGNLINSSRGINGLVFDIVNLPGGASSNLSAADFEFQMSPTGAFIEAEHPPAAWTTAPVPSSISIIAGSQGSPDRVVLQWPDNAIANRWLRITVKATANTGLTEPEVYYIGHLRGETTGPSGEVYTVSFADITPIRSAVGQSVDAGSNHDIDKNGIVAFADISSMRSNVGAQLTNITIPASGTSGGQGGGQRLSNQNQIGFDGKDRSSSGLSLIQMPNLQELSAQSQPAGLASNMRSDDQHSSDLLSGSLRSASLQSSAWSWSRLSSNTPSPTDPFVSVPMSLTWYPIDWLTNSKVNPCGSSTRESRIEEEVNNQFSHSGWALELDSLLEDPAIIGRWARV